MKRLFFFFAALLCCVSSFAQMNFVATLQHNDSISHYYGQEALAQAYDAAVDGDTITLSAGTFNVYWGNNRETNAMNKSITIRGTGGIGGDTRIRKGSGSNQIWIFPPKNSMTMRFEGVSLLDYVYIFNHAQYDQENIEFIKCRINYLNANASEGYTTESPRVYLYNCLIYEMYFENPCSFPRYSFVNCFVQNPHSVTGIGNNTSIFDHCLINYDSSYQYLCHYLNFTNCIITSKSYVSYNEAPYRLPNTATAANCLSVHNPAIFRNSLSSTNNQFIDDIASVFKTFNYGVGEDETFELTDEAKTTYLGNDSTQLGMHGGIAPYNTKMQYPVVTKLMPEPRTTKDGKLTIDVQVDGK